MQAIEAVKNSLGFALKAIMMCTFTKNTEAMMYKLLIPALILGSVINANAQDTLTVTVEGIPHNGQILPKNAYCIATKSEKSGQGENVSPAISWTQGPEGTKSYLLIEVDEDVPTDFTNAGKEGTSIPKEMKRQNFYHWLLADIPTATTSIAEGRGKDSSLGIRGVNDYAKFGKDAKPEDHLGYDGSCPPWNDERLHHYHFRVYALNVESLGLKEGFSSQEALDAMKGHVLAQGESVGTYTLNPTLR